MRLHYTGIFATINVSKEREDTLPMNIRQASAADMDGIFSLLKTYHVQSISPEDKKDGFVTTNMTPEQMTRVIVQENGITVAEEKGTILGFAMAASWDFWKEWPLFAHMIEKLPEFTLDGQTLSTENSYQYGPVCVDRSVRGTGVFEEIFYASLAQMRSRFPIMATFINQINPRSYAAHTKKVPMTTAGTFDFNGNRYYLMACPTTLTK